MLGVVATRTDLDVVGRVPPVLFSADDPSVVGIFSSTGLRYVLSCSSHKDLHGKALVSRVDGG